LKIYSKLILGIALSFFISKNAYSLTIDVPDRAITTHNSNITPITSFDNIDKKAVKWKYNINYKELPYLPDLYVDGFIKYIPVDIVRNLGLNLILDKNAKTAYITNNADTFLIKENSKKIYVNNDYFELQNNVIWANDTLYFPMVFLLQIGAMVSESAEKSQISILKNFNSLKQVSTFFDNKDSKLIFEFTQVPIYEFEKNKNVYKITLLGTQALDKSRLEEQLKAFDFEKISIDDSKYGILTITLKTKTEIEEENIFYLEKPHRLVLQIPKIYRDETRTLSSQGLYHSKISIADYNGLVKINTLEVSPKDVSVQPAIARDGDSNISLKQLKTLLKDNNAIAGINGGYFSAMTKTPLGLVFINGETISTPIYNRSAFIMNKDKTLQIDNIDLKIYLKIYNSENTFQNLKFNAYNQAPMKDQLVLFSNNYGKTLPIDIQKIEKSSTDNSDDVTKKTFTTFYNGMGESFYLYKFNKDDNKLSKLDKLTNEISQNTFILYASGKAKERLEKLLETASKYEINFNYSMPMENVLHALGGGPTLIKNKEIHITSIEEKFKPDIASGRAPRTAIGILNNNKLLLATVDGRQLKSIGFTLEELAYFLKQYGSISALNLDGGGSTTIYLKGNRLNSVSDPQERKVSTGLLIF